MTLPRLTFTAATHTYTLDDARVPSVTGILAPLIDFSNLPPFVRAEALLRGRIVHDAIDADNRHDLDHVEFARLWPKYPPYVAAWRSFRESRGFVPMFNEYRVASPRHLVAGTIDALGILDDHAALIDYKTGKPGDVCADLQTAGYLGLALEWSAAGDDALAAFFTRYPIIRRHAIQLRPDGTFRVETYANPKDFRDFLALTAAHHIIAARRGPRDAEAA